MRHVRLGCAAATLTSLALALPAGATADTTPPPAPAVSAPAPQVPAGCSRAFTAGDHRRYAKRVFKRSRITRGAKQRLTTLRRCQAQGRDATRSARRAERRLARWRGLYHCTQGKVVNCIRAATRRYGGDFGQNVACARSESGLNPYAHNRGGSGAAGLYQFMPSTWASTLARMGVRHKSIYSAKWQARAAAWKFRRDGFGEWTAPAC